MRLTIQIVNYNSRGNLDVCLRSIKENICGDKDIQIVVVNNDKEPLANSINGIKPEIIEKNENIGFGKAHNLGIQAAKGEYVLFLNPDAKLLRDTVGKLVEALQADEKIGIIGPVHIGERGIAEEECFGKKKTPLSTIGAKIIRAKNKALSGDIFETDWVSGGAMMTRRCLFSEVGGFDENYFMYFEDVDFCLRIKKRGWKVAVHSGAKIFHKSGQSFSDNKRKKKYYYDSQAYYIRNNFGLAWALLMRILRFPFYLKNVYFNK